MPYMSMARDSNIVVRGSISSFVSLFPYFLVVVGNGEVILLF